MKASSPTVYEVHCPHCRVTFPVGARRCVHCGGRLTRDREPATAAPMMFEPVEEPAQEESPRGSPFSPVALIWVLLFVAGTLYRACTGG